MEHDAARVDFEAWVRANAPALLRFAYLTCGGDRAWAEDILQSALYKLWRHWPKVRAMDFPYSYARQIVVREHISFMRLKRSREVPTGQQGLVEERGADQAQPFDAVDAVWFLLRDLPRRQQAVLALRHLDDLDDDAIAAALGVSASTVRSQAARGLAALRAGLRKAESTTRVSAT